MSQVAAPSPVPALDDALVHLRRALDHLEAARAGAAPIPDATAWQSPAGRAFHARARDWVGRMTAPALRADHAVEAIGRARAVAVLREAAGG